MMPVNAIQLIVAALPPQKRQQLADLIDEETVAKVAQVDPAIGQYIAQFVASDFKVQGQQAPQQAPQAQSSLADSLMAGM